jgi:hypothetical protein
VWVSYQSRSIHRHRNRLSRRILQCFTALVELGNARNLAIHFSPDQENINVERMLGANKDGHSASK